MKKIILLFLLACIGLSILFLLQAKQNSDQKKFLPETITKNLVKDEKESEENLAESTVENLAKDEEAEANMANPASKYCEENGGDLEIITETDGTQFGMCNFDDWACEEWAYFRGECDIEKDAEKIKEALIAKGLDLTEMKVMINKHLGKYIGGSVLPISAPAGGGYVFAVKDDSGDIEIVADGNGAIMCSMLEDYPDFPASLISECINESGSPVAR